MVVYAALIGAVFVVDLATPPGLNVPILYLVPLLGAFLLDDVRVRFGLTAIVTALTIGAIPLVWGETWHLGLINRSFDLGVFAVALALSIRDAQTTGELMDLKHAIDAASIVLVADPRGIIRHVNDRLCEVSGYSRDELIGGDWRMLQHDPGRLDNLRTALAGGRVWQGELQHRAKDGAVYWVETTVVPFLGDGGRPYQYLSVSNDVTLRKQAEARLRQQTALERIGEMAALVAHEVRNPLAGIRGGLQVIGSRPSLDPHEKVILSQMIERLDLLNVHVNDLLRFARPRSPQLEAVDLRTLLEETAQFVLRAGEPAGVDCRIVGATAQVVGDKAMLNEIFTNLFVNAAQAVTNNGRIVVTLVRSGDALDAMVADNGSGIPPMLHQRVFEPFYTTKPGGTGLGLAIVKQLVELQGGQVDIVMSPGPGTTVRVRLPCASPDAADGPSEERSRSLR